MDKEKVFVICYTAISVFMAVLSIVATSFVILRG